MTDQDTDTHGPTPATEPLALRLSEGLGPNAEDDECSAPPRVTDPPADLWLVYGELEHDDAHWICCRDGEVTWCEDKQYDSDVHYVRGDRYDDLHTALAELLACHTESAGWSMSMLANRAEFDAMLARSQERIEAAVGAARVALGA